MSIIGNQLSTLMNQRIQWLGTRAQVLTGNLTRAEMNDARRDEVKPFREVIESQKTKKSKSTIIGRELNMSDSDILRTRVEISRESEMLEISNNTAEHEAMMGILKKLINMLRSMGAKSQS
jgi:flagellar basal body rod protein FlgB